MANINEVAGFDYGYAPHMGSIYSIKKNDKINSVTLSFAHLPLSTTINYGITISKDVGRIVRGAIWVIKDQNNWSILKEPDYRSVETFNTNDLPIQSNPNSVTFSPFTFTFNTPKIYADNIIIGVTSGYDDALNNCICYQKDSNSTQLIYARDILSNRPYEQLTSNNGMKILNVNKTSYLPENEEKPTLSVSNIVYRTLSFKSTNSSE